MSSSSMIHLCVLLTWLCGAPISTQAQRPLEISGEKIVAQVYYFLFSIWSPCRIACLLVRVFANALAHFARIILIILQLSSLAKFSDDANPAVTRVLFTQHDMLARRCAYP